MKILLVGTFLPGRMELSYERAFRQLGCEVKRFDTSEVKWILNNFWEPVINKRIWRDLNNLKPDLVLVIKGYCLWPKTIKKIRELKRCLVFCFNSDNPFNLISRGASNKNILSSIPYYDCYFTFSRRFIEFIRRQGAERVEYLPFGFDPDLHYPVSLTDIEKQKYGNDIVFVGNWDEEREYWLKFLKNFDLGIWGENYWRRRCKDKDLRLKWRRKAMYGEDMSRVLNSSKISLNILRVQNKGSHNMRTFEAPACGAFVLAERSDEAREFFEEDKEAVYFSTPEELRDKARYYLEHDEERRKIARAGYQRCMTSDYSYLDRTKKILKVYEELSG
jgi:spore maturation protein CgeB